MPLPPTITTSSIWQQTLAERPDDKYAGERERLRQAFVIFRERAAFLAAEARRDLPDLTVHDVSHLDSLWETASLVTGDNYFFTPTEAFFLGGSFLLHDLALSVAATPGGMAAIVADPRWRDLVFAEYRCLHDREPTADEEAVPEAGVKRRALLSLLRQIHAASSERLAFLSFKATDGSPLFIIEDSEIRQTFGGTIGKIAHSHWWSIAQVESIFSRVIGAPHWCPPEWTIDPLKVACVLRVADGANIDARRAPAFLKAFSKLSSASEKHWRFQEKLNKPYLRDDALVFTSGSSFSLEDAGSWWLCLETLKSLDRELRGVDALFSDTNGARLAARNVAGVDLPERLASYIQTSGWHPINAVLQVSDLPHLIKSVGGEELYGHKPEAALREAIQNGCDAIRARRLHEKRDGDYGRITVALSSTSSTGWCLEVSDNGVGMSQRVLTEFLLDFGHSFWGSSQMQEEFPGLLSSGIKATGQYGIGFFSVFMIARQVQVITRRSDAARNDTLVLEFSSGLEGRPILRPAGPSEQLIDGGTTLKLFLQLDPNEKGGLLSSGSEEPETLVELCTRLCPALDVDLAVRDGSRSMVAISGEDWKNINGEEFLKRLQALTSDTNDADLEDFRKRASSNLRLLSDHQGNVLGRACISAGYGLFTSRDPADLHGVVTVGGLYACILSGIVGVLVGTSLRASRDAALPLVPSDVLRNWAEEQATLVPNLWPGEREQMACAQYIWLCGGHTKKLPIAMKGGKWVSSDDLLSEKTVFDEYLLLDQFEVEYRLKAYTAYQLADNVVVTNTSSIPGLLGGSSIGRNDDHDWPAGVGRGFAMGSGALAQTLGGAVIQALAAIWGTDVESVVITNRSETERLVVGTQADGTELRSRAIRVGRPVSN